MKFLKSLLLAVLGILTPVLCSCNKEELEDPTESSDFVIDQKYFNLSVNKQATTLEIPVQTNIHNSEWYVEYNVNWIMSSLSGPTNGEGIVKLKISENTSGEVRTATVRVSTTTKSYNINIKQWANSDLNIEGDFQVKPTGATATNYQSGAEIAKSYDDDVNTVFHSSWSKPDVFPFELKYNFSGDEEINYIDYIPRSGGGNGCFGEFELFVATDSKRTDFSKVGEYNFNGAATPGRVSLPAAVKPTSVKFMVKSGVGGFVSCAEMRFFRYNTSSTLDMQLLNVFTDITCSELKPGVTDTQIASLPLDFQRIAEALRDGSYDPLEKSFRIHQYKAYSNPTDWDGPLMTKKYSNWDNPMGIAVTKGEKVLILVGETHGNNVSVQIVGEQGTTSAERRPESQGSFHPLRPGVNQLVPDKSGQLFFMYTAVPSAPTSQPIKVHIPLGQGQFAGYWSLEEHKTDEKFDEIRRASTHDYFCVVGNRMLLYFKKSVLPTKILDPITQWDNIITWQQNFMGIEDVRPALWNNHIAGITMGKDCGYMWASDWCMGFEEGSVGKLMGLAKLNADADNAWGPAHEMGHVNQKAINWASTTESSNNLFSNYVLYRFGKYSSRGSGLYYRFKAVYEDGNSWASMLNGISDGPSIPRLSSGDYFDENTGIHMRMNWQLWNYYHRVRGDEKFFGRVFKKMRDLGINETENCGKKQLEFAVACAEAAGEDLTDFFEAWGFFRAHNSTVSQYGTYQYRVTTDMIADAKRRIAAAGRKAAPVEYIEDRDVKSGRKPGDYPWDMVGDLGYYETFAKNPAISSGASATISGRTITAKNCSEAVALEIRVRKGNDYGEIRYASNYLTFDIPSKIQTSGCALYAVRANGDRILLMNL